MVSKDARLEAWPLLPRPLKAGQTRPEDEPAQAAATAAVALAGLFLVLRNLPGFGTLGHELALLVALAGCHGSLAVTIATFSLLCGAAVAAPIGFPAPLRRAALGVLDHLLHLALVLSVAGVLGVIVRHGGVPAVAVWFAVQALLLVAGHRLRLWLSDRSAA